MKSNIQFSKIVFFFLLLSFGVNAWGATESLTCTAGTIQNNTMTFSTPHFSVVHAKAADANFASYSPWRVYTNNTVTFTALSGVETITSITIYTASSTYANAANGLITVVGGGSATVSVSGNNCIITITGKATSVVVDPTAQTRWNSIDINYTLASSCVNSTTSFASASVTKVANDAPFTNSFSTDNTSSLVWSSSNSAVATVDASGLVTPVFAGVCSILVNQSFDGTHCSVVDASYELTVTPAPTSEPTSHATALTASTNTSSEVTILWSDAVGGTVPTGYLLKASPSTVVAPVDGVFEVNNTLVQNVLPGVGSAVFSGLSSSVNYKFSIWPYTNDGSNVDFKTDGVAPRDSASTVTSLVAPVALSATNITGGGFTANWQAVSGATGYIVDVNKVVAGSSISETEGFDGVVPNGNLISSATYLNGWSVSSQSTFRQIYTTTGNFGLASPSLAFTITGDYLKTKLYSSAITQLQFWVKQQSGTTSYTLIEGYNGSTWEAITTLMNGDLATASTKTYDLVSLGKLNIYQIRFTFTKVAGNLSIDDIAITTSSSSSTSAISGSPFAAGGDVLSYPLVGLSSGSYNYTVKATDGVNTTDASNVMDVVVDVSVGLKEPSVAKVYVRNGLLVVEGGVSYAVFNIQGVKLFDGKNRFRDSLSLKSGVYLVVVDGHVHELMVN